jgi:hypothetical protein
MAAGQLSAKSQLGKVVIEGGCWNVEILIWDRLPWIGEKGGPLAGKLHAIIETKLSSDVIPWPPSKIVVITYQMFVTPM